MKSKATARFWRCFDTLPPNVRRLAHKTYRLWQSNPSHPSLHFKKLEGGTNRFSVRVGTHYRVIGHLVPGGVEWVWIGSHTEYDQLLRRSRMPAR